MGFYLLLKVWTKNVGKNISKSLSGKYSQKLIDHVNNLPQMRLKIAKETGDLIGNKIVNKIAKISKGLPQNNFKQFKVK